MAIFSSERPKNAVKEFRVIKSRPLDFALQFSDQTIRTYSGMLASGIRLEPFCFQMELDLLKRFSSSGDDEDGSVKLFLEHFSTEEQDLLDGFAAGDLSLEDLFSAYDEREEGHNARAYAELLNWCKGTLHYSYS